MTTPEQQERITRWLDGAMTGAEKTAFQAELERDPALRAEVAAMEKLGGLVRDHASMEKPVPGGDFFNSQIQERIEELRRADARRQATPLAPNAWLGWLRTPWAAAAAALIALGLFVTLRGAGPQTQVVSVYTPNPAVTATVAYSDAAGATVLTLDGLGAFPDDRNISGLDVHHSENDPSMAATTLFDANGGVLLVMATDARNQPLLIGRRANGE